MKRKRHSPEQIIRKLREAERLLEEGIELPEVMRRAPRGRRGAEEPSQGEHPVGV